MLVCDVFIVDDVGNTMMFHVKKSTEMGKIKEMYSERYMIPVTSIDFFFDGRKIHDDDTPKGLELEEGDAIEVHKVSGGRASKMPGGGSAYDGIGNIPFGFCPPGYSGGRADDLNREMLTLLLDSWRSPFPDVNQDLAMTLKVEGDGLQFLACPYNPRHKIAIGRTQPHLVKCRRSHPYNANHRVPRPEEQFHVTPCPDAHRCSFPEAKSDGRQEKKPDCIKKAFRAVRKVCCCI